MNDLDNAFLERMNGLDNGFVERINGLDNAFVERDRPFKHNETIFSGSHPLQYEKTSLIVFEPNKFLLLKKVSWEYAFTSAPFSHPNSPGAEKLPTLEPVSLSLKTAQTQNKESVEFFKAKGSFNLDYKFDRYHLLSDYLHLTIENPNCLCDTSLHITVTMEGIWVTVPWWASPSLEEVEKWAQTNLGITTKVISDGNHRPNAVTQESLFNAKERLRDAIEAKNIWLTENTIPSYEMEDDSLQSSSNLNTINFKEDSSLLVKESQEQEKKVSWTRYLERQQERRKERYQPEKPKSKGFFRFLFGLSLLLNSPLLFELLPILVVLYVC